MVHILEEVWWQPTGVEKSAGLPKSARGSSFLAGRWRAKAAVQRERECCGRQTCVGARPECAVSVWEAGQAVQAKDAKSPETALCVHSCSRASLGVLPAPHHRASKQQKHTTTQREPGRGATSSFSGPPMPPTGPA